MKYQKILVAIDRSSQAEAVFEQALDLAKKEGAALMVFHCLPTEEVSSSYTDMFGSGLANFSAEMQAVWEQQTKESREWLTDYGQKATAEGVPTEWDMKVGEPGSAIRQLVKAWGADLVVVGRRGRQGLGEILLGSVSNHIIHHVRCSVLVVQGIGTEN
ncbi:MAG: universal stress protein [Coleofasciculaceae cyanobacterium]